MPVIHSSHAGASRERDTPGPREPVHRDLTKAFQRHRAARHKALADRAASLNGVHGVPGAETLLGGHVTDGEESATARERATLPPQWVDAADRAAEEIKDIRVQLAQLTKAQQRRLLKVFATDEADKEVEVISGSIAALIKCCERSIHAVRMGTGPNTTLADEEFRLNMQRKLATQLSEVSKECREKQKWYLAEVKKRQHQGDVEAGVFGDGAEGSGPPGEYQPSQAQLLELDNMEEFAAKRNIEIAGIVQSVNELNQIFKELAVLVIEQGTVLDRIDYNTEKIYKKANDGRRQMEKAVVRKKKNDTRTQKCFLFWGAADLLALVILLIKYKLKYGLKNVFIFLCVVASLVGAAWLAKRRYGLPSWVPTPENLAKKLPDLSPWSLWRKFRPGPINSAKAAAGKVAPGGLNALRHVWRPPGGGGAQGP